MKNEQGIQPDPTVAARASRTAQIGDCTDCFALPGGNSIIDTIHPQTGKSWFEGETLEQIRARYTGAEKMTLEAFCQAKAARQHTLIEWTETTEERYWNMLEVLPPAIMLGGNFMVGEPCDHDASNGQPRFQAYRSQGGKYFEANRPMTVKEFKASLAEKFASVAAEVVTA